MTDSDAPNTEPWDDSEDDDVRPHMADADRAVRLGDPAVWRAAAAALDRA